MIHQSARQKQHNAFVSRATKAGHSLVVANKMWVREHGYSTKSGAGVKKRKVHKRR